VREDAPILEFDPSPTAIIEPSMMRSPVEVPPCAVMCFFSDVIDRLKERGAVMLFELQAAHGTHPVHRVDTPGGPVAVFHPGVGAPLAGAFFEEAIASGCRSFVALGGAGSLRSDLTAGHAVVPSAAVRDEGTSYHYLPAAREVPAQERAQGIVKESLARAAIPFLEGKTWTTDALYRETRSKVDRRIAEGCVTVEMEASALLAVAAFRSVELGYLLAAADTLAGDAWDDRGFFDDTAGRLALFEVAAEAALALPAARGAG
jgi:uridine phosphorylase